MRHEISETSLCNNLRGIPAVEVSSGQLWHVNDAPRSGFSSCSRTHLLGMSDMHGIRMSAPLVIMQSSVELPRNG